LVEVAGDLNPVTFCAQVEHQLPVALERPDPNQLSRAGMQQDFAVRA
jgi:hypothetical protein